MFSTSEKINNISVSSASIIGEQKSNGIKLAPNAQDLTPMQVGILGYALPNYTKNEAIDFLKSKPEFLKYVICPDEILVEIVKYEPKYIQFIRNPSETVQISAIELSPSTLKLIKNPCASAKNLYAQVINNMNQDCLAFYSRLPKQQPSSVGQNVLNMPSKR